MMTVVEVVGVGSREYQKIQERILESWMHVAIDGSISHEQFRARHCHRVGGAVVTDQLG
jgi:hypothetical protein